MTWPLGSLAAEQRIEKWKVGRKDRRRLLGRLGREEQVGMLERAILEKKSIGYIATARGLFGH